MTDTLGATSGVDLIMERALENSLIGALGFADVAINTLLGDPQCHGESRLLVHGALTQPLGQGFAHDGGHERANLATQ